MANFSGADTESQTFRSETVPTANGEAPGATLYALDGGHGGTLRPVSVNTSGQLVIADANQPTAGYMATIYSADNVGTETDPNRFSSQAIIGHATIHILAGMTGTLTIRPYQDDSTHGIVLGWHAGGEFMPSVALPCANLNEFEYEFGTNAGTEGFVVMAHV